MDTTNWRPPTPGSEGLPEGDWRTQLLPESRSRIVNKIMETLKRHLPYSGPEGMNELKKIASRFEEKIYTSATSQPDYLRKISVKMLTMETKSHANGMPTNSGGNGSRPPDAGMQPQIQNMVQQIPNSLATPSQVHQQMLLQNNLQSATVQSSGSLSTTLPQASSLGGQTSSMQNANMQNVTQNSLVNTMAQGLNSNMFVGQRQMPGRQQVVPQQQQQQQQQSQNTQQQQFLYQQQQMLMKQKLQQGNMSHQIMTNQIQQQQPQQQNMLQAGQLQHQQSVMQPTAMQQGPLSGMQQNQQSSVQQSTQPMLQHHQQPVLRHQQQSQQPIHQQQQQQQQLNGQQQTMQPTQFSSQQNNMSEMQQSQQQPKMMSQQNNHQNLQQQQQQLMSQQNNLSNLHPQQLAPQTNVSGLHQQQPLMGSQSGGQHPVHMLQSSKAVQQQMQSGSSNMLQSQGQQPQLQTMQQQLMSQMQSQPGQLQQQVGLPQQQQTSMQQRVQPSGSLLQQQNVIDQQKQMFQSQRALPETSMDSATSQPGHASGGDWQEELHQKIKAMKDSYFPELNAMYQRIAVKLQQHDALPQQPKSDQIDKLRVYKTMLERLLSIMQCPKTELSPSLRDKLDQYEKQIVNLINMNKPRKPGPMQQNQIHPHHMSSMQPPQSQSQMSQVSSLENQMNPQMQTSMSLQNQVPASSVSSVSNPQQTMMNSLQHNPGMENGQGNAMGTLQQQQQQQVGVGQQNSVSSAQQMNMSAQSGLNMLQNNVNNLQTNMNMLQHQNLKPHQEQHMLQQTQQQQQQLKQIQHRMLQKQQIMQQQQQQQQLHQQAKQQLPTQLQTHQMSQIHQMNEVADVKLRSNIGVKGVFQHQTSGPRPPYAQMKAGSSFPISSPQLLQAQSPQLSQHSSPQIDQQNMLTSITKIGTPLQSANSPFVVPSPSTPLAPSPMPGDPEKSISGMQTHSNAGNMGYHHNINSAQAVTAPSPAIGTPGISASPLLAEFSGPDGGAHGHPSTAVSSKSTLTELPIERLMRVVKSLPSQSLRDSVADISSVVSMVDRIAGAAPGNGSRAAVGEDLVAMTKCRLQARNFMLQDGPTGSRKMRRYTSAMPLNAASSAGSVNDSFKRSMGAAEAADLESTATSNIKRTRLQGNHALLEQISEINQKLMDTVVDIYNEEVDTSGATGVAECGDGVIVKCSFNAVALSPELKSQYASAQLSPIQPLRLLVPSNYPNCSPVFLDKFPVEVSRDYEDLSAKAKTRFSICLRSISQPMSLKDIARTWDDCCRAAILECAEKNGGGSFSSKYGTWESCLSA